MPHAPRSTASPDAARLSLVPPGGGSASWVVPALELAMEHLASPAFVVGRTGRVLHANRAGAAAVARDPRGLVAVIVDPIEARRAGLRRVALDPEETVWLVYQERVEDTPRVVDACAARFALDARDRRILFCLAGGGSNKEIARELGISLRSVELRVASLLERVGVRSRGALVAKLWEAA